MSDQFYPQNISSLLAEILQQLHSNSNVLGLPYDQIFIPAKHPTLQTKKFEQNLSTPYGVAAGPHTQLARNIISAWLMGARYIELKTIQTLDELSVSKPCIDMQDEGYNCEWSQELKIEQSFHEYLNAWMIIHILHHNFKWNGTPDTIFNMSVGYDMKGILNDNVQWFFQKMNDCSVELKQKILELKSIYPAIVDIEIPTQISNNITLSTMHGCPPNEIEEISKYLILQKNLHTTVKLNPTLLGEEQLREILNNKLNYPIVVPDVAFEHDIKFLDAVDLIKNLQQLSDEKGLHFAVKLTNTLEVKNTRGVLPEDMNYMSGRALHPISVNLAARLQNEFNGDLDISFSGGADAYNLVPLINSGLFPVTVSSDLLKPGGYGRLAQYYAQITDGLKGKSMNILQKDDMRISHLNFLKQYAIDSLTDTRYQYKLFDSKNIKSDRVLSRFDCIAAPCMEACPTEQDIPDYLYWAAQGNFNKALDVIYQKNPMPQTLGLVCEHGCQAKCTRINYDDPVRIRDIKEFIATNGESSPIKIKESNGLKVAIIGAGPSGLSAAWFLAIEGCEVVIYEKNSRAGGMPQNIIPNFRLKDQALQNDIDRILSIGVEIKYNIDVTTHDIERMKSEYNYVYIAAGAEITKKLNIPGEDLPVIKDALQFLRDYKKGKLSNLSGEILIIGGGNTAMDVARTAKRCLSNGKVTIVYRRSLQQMPAEAQEIRDAINEGIQIKEFMSPCEIKESNGNYILLTQKMELISEKTKDGRFAMKAIKDEFEDLKADLIIAAVGQMSLPLVEEYNEINNLEKFDDQVNIYLGGDASRGASSIVQAVGDGRLFAEHILKLEEILENISNSNYNHKRTDTEHLSSRSLKSLSFYPELPANPHKSQVIEEAKRCLQCDEYCNVCVSVCPNRANQTYQIIPQKYTYQDILVSGHGFTILEKKVLSLFQESQIYNIGDYCNECGNCTTFCPTSGDPYLDKPQIHRSQTSFNNAKRGYWVKDGIIYIKNEQRVSQLIEEAGKFYFEDDRLEVVLAKDSLIILDVYIKEEANYLVDLSSMVEIKLLMEANVL